MAYDIQINEYQRQLLMKVLVGCDVSGLSRERGSGDVFDSEAEEFVCLVQMFGTLPNMEADSPGCLHGFCL